MLKNLLSIVIIASCFSGVYGQTPLETAIAKASDYFQNEAPVGMSVMVISGDEMRFVGMGEAIKGSGIQPTQNTVYPVGELSQLVTSALLADFEHRGLISSDDPIRLHIPTEVRVPDYQAVNCTTETRDFIQKDERTIYYYPSVCFPDPDSPRVYISVCNLATHASALPLVPPRYTGYSPTKPEKRKKLKNHLYDHSALLNDLGEVVLRAAPGSEIHNSAFAHALLATILTNKTEVSFTKLADSLLFQPLGMISASYGDKKSTNKAKGYSTSKKPMPELNTDAMTPAWGLQLSNNDMLQFIRAQIGTGNPYWSDVLVETQSVRVPASFKDQSDMGLGWQVNHSDQVGDYNWMSGKVPGVRSYIAFSRENKCAVVIFANSPVELKELGEDMLLFLCKSRAAGEPEGK